MPLLKDTEREQLRQLVKACLLEISKLKVELKKCQNESLKSKSTDNIQLKAVKDEIQKQLKAKNADVERVKTELQKQLKEKNGEIKQLKVAVNEKNVLVGDLETELEKMKTYFEALTEKPKKDLTSFQSQIYQLLPSGENTEDDLYAHIYSVGFRELSTQNFMHALRNLERKGYFRSRNNNNGETLWEKIDR